MTRSGRKRAAVRAKPGSARPGPARPGRSRQRQRLIDACISALHTFGPSRTTVGKVVAIAKMSPGIVRFYFDSKEAMLVASLKFLASEFEEQVLAPVAKLRSSPVAALQLMVDLYLDPEIASPRKVSVWYAFWGEASSRQEYYDICGQKDESFAALVRELVESLIVSTGQRQLDADGVALGLIGALEMMWQEFAFQDEGDIDRDQARRRCLGYLRSVFPGQFADSAAPAAAADSHRWKSWVYGHAGLLARERELVFGPSWAFVGHESELPKPRDYLCAAIGAERAMVIRNDHGMLDAFRNSCPESPHELITARRGRFDDDIRCRPHGLHFSVDGSAADGTRSAGLTRLECRVLDGLIFARLPLGRSGNDDPMGVVADPPSGHMALAPPRESRVDADWKLLVEQWLQSVPHAAFPSTGTEGLAWSVGIEGDERWSARRYLDILAGAVPDRPPAASSWARFFMPPNQLFETRPDGISVVQVLPLAPGRSLVRRSDYSILPPDVTARALVYLASRLGPSARWSDAGLAASTQSGMTGFAYRTAASRSAAPGIAWFHDWLLLRLPSLALDRPPDEP